MKIYDVMILGGGPGGYTAAVRAAQIGHTVAIIEQDKLGGTCLHKGCIPSKALLRSAEVFETMKRSLGYGIETEGTRLRFDLVQKRKSAIVEQLYKGIQFLMKKNRVDVYSGQGSITAEKQMEECNGVVTVNSSDEEQLRVGYRKLIIATGSRPRSLPGLHPDGTFVLSSNEALEMEKLPASMLIIGGGVIGVEWVSMLNDFGIEVTVVEYADRLLPTEDTDISRELQRLYAKRGIKVLTGAQLLVETLEIVDGRVHVQVQQGDNVKDLMADKILVAVGRLANVTGFGLEHTEVCIERDIIVVDDNMCTADPHIYAIGDVTGGLQLAHVASHEGIIAIEHLSGLQVEHIDNSRVPRCIYGRPEIASVGLTERQATERGHEVKTGKFSFKGIGKALVYGEADGFVKVVADSRNDEIVGVHMIGPHVTEYISEASLAQLLGATTMQIGKMIHPHPTMSEIIGEAMLASNGSAIHM